MTQVQSTFGFWEDKQAVWCEGAKPVASPLAQYPKMIDNGFGRMVERPPIYLSGVSNASVMSAARDLPNLGVLVTPATSCYVDHIDAYEFFAIDNGCFSGQGNFDEDKFYRILKRVKDEGKSHKCLFAVAPDVFDPVACKGDWKATVERSLPHLARIRAMGVPAAIVLQDGATADTIPWDKIDVLFVGGSTEFKIGADETGKRTCRKFVEIVREAKKRNIPMHFGRVNSWLRMEIVHYGLFADSMDGTYIKFGPEENLANLKGWLKPWGKFPSKCR